MLGVLLVTGVDQEVGPQHQHPLKVGEWKCLKLFLELLGGSHLIFQNRELKVIQSQYTWLVPNLSSDYNLYC